MIRVHPMFNEAILTLAWFAAINVAASIVVLIAARFFGDSVGANPARARRLALARLAPSVLGAIGAFGLFLPAHLTLEPPRSDEWLGPWTLTVGMCGIALVLRSLFQLAATWRRSARLVRDSGRDITRGRFCMTEVPLLPGIALAGIMRPRILVGEPARRLLSGEELDVTLAHELAHQQTGDNLTRVLMRCAPDFLAGTRTAHRLETLWAGEAECLADATAVGDSPTRAALLASALVKIGRLAVGEPQWSPEWSALHHPALLELRVRRLVSGMPVGAGSSRWFRLAAALSAVAVAVAWSIGLPTELHWLTERLLHS
jgi:Zn-dependent protease with chaperone function